MHEAKPKITHTHTRAVRQTDTQTEGRQRDGNKTYAKPTFHCKPARQVDMHTVCVEGGIRRLGKKKKEEEEKQERSDRSCGHVAALSVRACTDVMTDRCVNLPLRSGTLPLFPEPAAGRVNPSPLFLERPCCPSWRRLYEPSTQAAINGDDQRTLLPTTVSR